jgi:glycosyltransferase involved in cell wall biosynthesis
MINGHDIIYFGPEKWEGLWRNRHQLMSRFAKLNRVLYVEPRISLRRFLNIWAEENYKSNIISQAIKQPRLTKAGRNLYVHHNPFFIPIIGRFPFGRLTKRLWEISLKYILFKLEFKNPIVWLSKPDMTDYSGKFNEKLLIYHVVDEYLTYGGITEEKRPILEKLEKKALKQADLVIVVSKNLMNNKKPFNKNTYLVPNATDYEGYSKIRDGAINLPDDILQLPRPIIGYSGLISSRLNLDLLLFLAQTMQEWSIALIGHLNARHSIKKFDKLKKLPNVYFLGRKHISEIPCYLKAVDVGIIPYKINENSQSISPLKLYDYLAMGKPIVTTDFTAAHEFKDFIRISDTKEEFVLNIQEALETDNNELYVKRIRHAAKNTWDDRVSQISDLILSHLSQKNIFIK